MANVRKLGIYWGSSGINLVELNKDTPLASTFVSFADFEKNSTPGISHLSDDLRLLDMLQKATNAGSFSVGNAFLSIPSKDIIVRWFLIPLVKPDDVQGVVAFEAKKYVPFALDDLYFNYYPTPVTKDGVRHIGIALTAIRKANYDRYKNILTQAGINVVYSEPSATSLLRTLVYRKLLVTDQVSAILIAREDSCELVIASKGYVRFIRDFSMLAAQLPPDTDADEFFRLKLFNEVRMSLDFFIRNNAGIEVDRLIAIASGMKMHLFEGMGDDIALPVKVLEHSQILDKTNALVDIGYIRAFGVGLSGDVPAVVDFNLSEGNVHGAEKKNLRPGAGHFPAQALMTAGVVLACGAIIALSFWWSDTQLRQKQLLKQEVSARLGRYLDIPMDDIDAKLRLMKKKIESVKSLPLKSSLAAFFVHFTQQVPEGVWLDTIDISYDMSGMTSAGATGGKAARQRNLAASDYYTVKLSSMMLISGFVSLGDTNAEFEVVNQFVGKITADPLIKQVFADIKLKSLQARESNLKQKFTAFTIEFK